MKKLLCFLVLAFSLVLSNIAHSGIVEDQAILDAYKDLQNAVGGAAGIIINLDTIDLESMSETERQEFLNDLKELLGALPSPAIQQTLFYGLFLVDAPVEGIEYQSDARSGVTDSNGQFIFEEGDTISFFLGGIQLGQVVMESQDTPIVTPKVLATSTTQDPDVQTAIEANIFSLLQTLDSDGDSTNGITISDAVRESALGLTSISVSQSEETFSAISDLTSFLVTAAETNSYTMDTDGDGVVDALDAFPFDSFESVDTDNDGIGNNADVDDDNDGVQDSLDAFPLDASQSLVVSTTDSKPGDISTSGNPDGILDVNDAVEVLRIVLGIRTDQPQEADVSPLGNPDGQLDVNDAVVILQNILGIVDEILVDGTSLSSN